MPYNGSGVYNPPSAPTFPAIPNTTIESTKFNDTILDIAINGLTKCITRDGQSPAQANLPMAGFRHTGVGNAVSATDYAAFGQVPGLKGLIGATNWDNFTLIGVYEATASALTGPATNFPPTSEIGQLVVLPQGANIVQVYFATNATWNRQKVGSTWSAWTASPLLISTNTTLQVPSEYPTVTAAMEFLGSRQIGRGVTVTINIAAGTIVEPGTLNLNHPQGSQIRITGAGIATTILDVKAGAATGEITVTTGNTFGEISNLRILGAGGDAGILVDSGSRIDAITSVNFNSMTTGLIVRDGSSIGALTACSDNVVTTFLSIQDFSFVETNGVSVSHGVTVSASQLLWGGGLISGVAGNGVTLTRGSTVLFSTLTISNCTSSGIFCDDTSQVIVIASFTLTLNNNTLFGINYGTNGRRAIGTLAGAGNGSGLESAAVSNNAGTLEASTGDITLTPGAGSNVRFGTFTAAADAVSTGYIEIKDAAGNLRRVMVRA